TTAPPSTVFCTAKPHPRPARPGWYATPGCRHTALLAAIWLRQSQNGCRPPLSDNGDSLYCLRATCPLDGVARGGPPRLSSTPRIRIPLLTKVLGIRMGTRGTRFCLRIRSNLPPVLPHSS